MLTDMVPLNRPSQGASATLSKCMKPTSAGRNTKLVIPKLWFMKSESKDRLVI